jgi:hypothetical protein
MCDGTLLPHSGQLLKIGARQRVAPRRIFWRLLDWRRFGTAMVVVQLSGVLEVLENVESRPTVVTPGAGRSG